MFASLTKGLTKKPKYGRLYVLQITLECGKVIHKVGMTYSDRATDRMLEILRSFFNTYRYIPMCKLRKDKKVFIPLLVEKYMHEILDEWSYTPDKPFDGSTEFFHNLDEQEVLEYLDTFKYSDLLANKISMKQKDLENIRAAIVAQESSTPKNSKDEIIPF